MTYETDTTKQPAPERIKLGRITAKIWENQNDAGSKFYSVSFSRTYVDDASGEFKETSSFSRDDLTCIEVLAKQADEKIAQLIAG